MNLEHTRTIRDLELKVMLSLIRRHMPADGLLDVLDVGAGAGWQAAGLASEGHRVAAVDIASSAYAGSFVYPVQAYDGKSLPFADAAFDVVLSSNVLEHVSDLTTLLVDMRRVLRPGGVAIHVLPTPTWRIWTTLAHPLWLLKRSVQLLSGRRPRELREGGDSPEHAEARTSASILWPARHGERGGTMTEIWYFSAPWWRTTFKRSGWVTEEEVSCRLFYTGAMLLGGRLGGDARSRLSMFLGGSTRAYVARPLEEGAMKPPADVEPR